MWDWVDASRRDEDMWEQQWIAHCREEAFAKYLCEFSSETPLCIGCGEPTEDEYQVCWDCRMRQMHDYY